MKTVRRECQRGYQHYFVRTLSECVEMDVQLWDRTITLECHRCGLVLWIDSVIKTYFDVKSENDWGT